MSVAVVADAHLGGPGGAAEPLVDQLRRLPEQGCRRLVLLGDLFHVWIGDRRYETPEIAATVEALRWLRGRGVRVDYIEGNRDFFLDGSPYADAFDGLHRELEVATSGARYLFVHGDGLDERDWKYRFWRWLSKSAPSRFLFRRIPGPLARRIVGSTERRLARSNFRHKIEIPRSVIARFARDRLADDIDMVVLGHFHDRLEMDLEGGAVLVLDAWFHHRQMRWLEEDRPGVRG